MSGAGSSGAGSSGAGAQADAPRFAAGERRLLLSEPGLGETVVARLERAGFHSLQQLHEVGALRAVLTVCAQVGSIGWANRRRPLERALARSSGANA